MGRILRLPRILHSERPYGVAVTVSSQDLPWATAQQVGPVCTRISPRAKYPTTQTGYFRAKLDPALRRAGQDSGCQIGCDYLSETKALSICRLLAHYRSRPHKSRSRTVANGRRFGIGFRLERHIAAVTASVDFHEMPLTINGMIASPRPGPYVRQESEVDLECV